MEKLVIPAIIAKSQEELEQRVNLVKDYSTVLQLDIMDGLFVPNHSLNFEFVLPATNCKYEAHLMVNDPELWIDKMWKKADTFLVHMESCRYPEKIIKLLKGKKKAGLVLNPETPVVKIEEYLDEIEQVLIMTVNPGFYGSKFLPETLEKVKELRKKRPNLDIEVDGGITADTIAKAAQSGANLFVSGSYVMKAENPQKALEILRGKLE